MVEAKVKEVLARKSVKQPMAYSFLPPPRTSVKHKMSQMVTESVKKREGLMTKKREEEETKAEISRIRMAKRNEGLMTKEGEEETKAEINGNLMTKRSEQEELITMIEKNELMAKKKEEDHEGVHRTFSMENSGVRSVATDGSGNFIPILPQSESGLRNPPPLLGPTFIGNSSNSTPSQVAPLEACIELGSDNMGDSKSSDGKPLLVHGNAIAANASPNPNDLPPPVGRRVGWLGQKSEPADDELTKLAKTTVPVRRAWSYVLYVSSKAFRASTSAVLLRLTTRATATRVLAKLAVIACVAGILATIQNDLPPRYLWVAAVAFLVPTACVAKA